MVLVIRSTSSGVVCGSCTGGRAGSPFDLPWFLTGAKQGPVASGGLHDDLVHTTAQWHIRKKCIAALTWYYVSGQSGRMEE